MSLLARLARKIAAWKETLKRKDSRTCGIKHLQTVNVLYTSYHKVRFFIFSRLSLYTSQFPFTGIYCWLPCCRREW